MTTGNSLEATKYPEIDAKELDSIKLEIEVWKKSVDVQQHFNDIEMRIRNSAVTLLGGILAATGLALNANRPLTAVWLLSAGLVTWLAFFFMDRYWYHQLLRGAVKNAYDIEVRLRSKVPGANLASTIGEYSKVKILGRDTNSTYRLDLFYEIVAVLLAISIVGLLLFSAINPLPSSGTNANPTATTVPATPLPSTPQPATPQQ